MQKFKSIIFFNIAIYAGMKSPFCFDNADFLKDMSFGNKIYFQKVRFLFVKEQM